MLDFNHILSTPGYDIQQFYGDTSTTLLQWKTWRKPRGVNWVYMIGAGGGGSGGCGTNTGATAGGGAGGNSAAQTTLLIPAQLVPDILYIQAGTGGIGPTTSAALGVAGQPTYVTIEPSTTLTPNTTLLYALGGTATATAATITVGGGVGTPPVAATIANMCLAARGVWTALGGQNGTSGGGGTGTAAPTNGGNLTLPITGLMVTGGTGGGGANNNSTNPVGNIQYGASAGSITGVNDGSIFFTARYPGYIGALGNVTNDSSAGGGNILNNSLMHYGGLGGQGVANLTYGSPTTAFIGSKGAPGCGGGGSCGAYSSANVLLKAGDGGPGFVYIISW